MRRPGSAGSVVSAIVVGAFAAIAGGCAFDPVEPYHDPSARPPSPSDSPSPPPSRRPPAATASPSPTGFSEFVATPCGGRPSGDQVVAAVRRSSALSAGARVTVTSAPTCAGTWQYTVLSVPDLEPVHVVTRGLPGALTVVTAGTNPCTPHVRVNAPAGILAVLRCDPVTDT